MSLKGKRLAFATAYAAHENGAQAVRDAGFKTKDAASMAYKLLRVPEVAAYIDVLRAERLKKFEVTGDRIIAEIAKIAFTDTSEIIKLAGGSRLTIDDFDKLTPARS